MERLHLCKLLKMIAMLSSDRRRTELEQMWLWGNFSGLWAQISGIYGRWKCRLARAVGLCCVNLDQGLPIRNLQPSPFVWLGTDRGIGWPVLMSL